jgi:hypothetical protein
VRWEAWASGCLEQQAGRGQGGGVIKIDCVKPAARRPEYGEVSRLRNYLICSRGPVCVLIVFLQIHSRGGILSGFLGLLLLPLDVGDQSSQSFFRDHLEGMGGRT